MNDLKIVLAAMALVGVATAIGLATESPSGLERHSQTMELRGHDSTWTRPFFEIRSDVVRSAARGQS